MLNSKIRNSNEIIILKQYLSIKGLRVLFQLLIFFYLLFLLLIMKLFQKNFMKNIKSKN